MKIKKLLAIFLAAVMVFCGAAVVSAEGWSVVCTTLGAVSSEPLPVSTAPKTWTFVSTSHEGTSQNYETAAINVFSGTGWEMTIRSDSFAVSTVNGWGTAGEEAVGGKAYPGDWTAWLAANQAGAPCKVTAQVVAGKDSNYIVVGFSNNGVTNVYKVPTSAALDSVNLYLTGENCTLTNLQSTDSHISLSGAIASIPTEEPTAWSVVCTTLGAVKSQALAVSTTPTTWTFTSTTNADAANNWDSAALDVTSGNGWELTVRSDSFAVSNANNWGTAGEDAFGGKSYPADWASWLEANHAGSSCKVTAQTVAGTDSNYIIVGFSNNGVTNIYVVPTSAAVDSVKVYLTGENCVLTDLQSSTAHIDLSAAAASVAPKKPEPSEPETTEPETTIPETKPETSEPKPTEPKPTEPETTAPESPSGWEVDCPTWWGGHSAPVKLTESIQSWTFTSTSYPDAVNNWETGTVVIWRSDNGSMAGPNYLEELLVRSDSYAVSEEFFWGTAGQNSFNVKRYPADWDAWLADNKAGASCTVTAQLVNGYIVVGFSNNGVTNVYVVPQNTTLGSAVYLSLTGEKCKLTGWASTTNHIDISAAAAYAASQNQAPADPSNPSTGDSALVLPMLLVMTLSVGALTVLSGKKRIL